jgi:glutathione S-transferase
MPLELQVVDLLTGEHTQPPFEAVNPNHLVPVLEDRTGVGIVLEKNLFRLL